MNAESPESLRNLPDSTALTIWSVRLRLCMLLSIARHGARFHAPLRRDRPGIAVAGSARFTERNAVCNDLNSDTMRWHKLHQHIAAGRGRGFPPSTLSAWGARQPEHEAAQTLLRALLTRRLPVWLSSRGALAVLHPQGHLAVRVCSRSNRASRLDSPSNEGRCIGMHRNAPAYQPARASPILRRTQCRNQRHGE